MAYPAYLRERARELRVTKKLSLNEFAERLALRKTTV
jgi:transcriptional regulator with XRE-family HTH domain